MGDIGQYRMILGIVGCHWATVVDLNFCYKIDCGQTRVVMGKNSRFRSLMGGIHVGLIV